MVLKDSIHGNERPVIIALDFDGVLHSYAKGWTGEIPLDPPVPGAQEFTQWLLDQGYSVVLFTTRAHPKLGKGRRAFVDHAIPRDDGSWENAGQKGVTLGSYSIRQWLRYWEFPDEIVNATITHKKEHADLYLDDRGFRFEGSFETVREFLERNPSCLPWGKQQ